MCHQAIEKILKALFSKIYDETPLFTHNLFMLSEKCGVINSFFVSQKDFLIELNPLNIEARYPEYKELVYKKIKKVKALEILENTRGLFKWIKSTL